MGINAEHSWADAPIIGHLWEVSVCRFNLSVEIAVGKPNPRLNLTSWYLSGYNRCFQQLSAPNVKLNQ